MSDKNGWCLSLGIAMINGVEKAMGAYCISKLRMELCASFECMRLGKVDDGKVRKFHYRESLSKCIAFIEHSLTVLLCFWRVDVACTFW